MIISSTDPGHDACIETRNVRLKKVAAILKKTTIQSQALLLISSTSKGRNTGIVFLGSQDTRGKLMIETHLNKEKSNMTIPVCCKSSKDDNLGTTQNTITKGVL